METQQIVSTEFKESIHDIIPYFKDLTLTLVKKIQKAATRLDLLQNLINLIKKKYTSEQIFNILINNNNNPTPSSSRQGFLYESLVEILFICKCGLGEYDRIDEGRIDEGIDRLQSSTYFKNILDKPLHQGNNISDLTYRLDNIIHCISIKYNSGKISKKGTDIGAIELAITKKSPEIGKNYKISLIVNDKNKIADTKGGSNCGTNKIIYNEIVKNNLLFDKKDVIKGIDIFRKNFVSYINDVNEFIEHINANFINSPRQNLELMFHQKIYELKFINSIKNNNNIEGMIWILDHVTRSGKSILMLVIIDYLFRIKKLKRILFVTSIPDTIDSIIKSLQKYIPFKDIKYYTQDDFYHLDKDFVGLFPCSMEFLKIDTKEKNKKLKEINFEFIIDDESQLGGTTKKTEENIFNISENTPKLLASGTSTKTILHYQDERTQVYSWDTLDTGYMKMLQDKNLSDLERDEIIEYMSDRHGDEFKECLNDRTLNNDYSHFPIPILMKYCFPEQVNTQINNYNDKNNTNSGCCWNNFLSLSQKKNDDNKLEYINQFEICKSCDGTELLIGALESIISNDRNNENTIMKKIEETQHRFNSRISSVNDPKVIILYLPINTGNSNINQLQITFINFIRENKLWEDYNIEYANGETNSLSIKEYDNFIIACRTEAIKNKKRGTILLLGNKGSVGTTYDDCDVTISLDNGSNIDKREQQGARAGTPALGKTVCINVDMNPQRVYQYIYQMITQYRKNTSCTKTNGEIMQYWYKHNIFLFNPQEFNNGRVSSPIEIMDYYDKEGKDIIRNMIDDTTILGNLKIGDDMNVYDYICYNETNQSLLKINVNPDLQGEQPDLPKGDIQCTQILPNKDIETEETETEDNETEDNETEDNETEDTETEDTEQTKIEQMKNQTLEVCRKLIPFLGILNRSHKIPFIDLMVKYKDLIESLLKEYLKITDDYNKIIKSMNKMYDKNQQIINDIFELYDTNDHTKLRDLISNHFIPTEQQRRENGEISSLVPIVNEMLNSGFNKEDWKQIRKIFEPCCGKGNFVIAIFDKFYEGLEDLIPDPIERCRVIIEKCLYFADLIPINVFIVEELLKCHVQSCCTIPWDELNWKFNSYLGDSLTINTQELWKTPLEEFWTVGNPPYATDPSKPNTKPQYNEWINKFNVCKKLLFVVPSRWFIGGKGLDTFRKDMMKRTDIKFINHEPDSKKWFGKSVKIEGGVNYFLKDSSYNGTCLFDNIPYDLSKYDRIISPKYHNIIDIISTITNNNNMKSISEIYKGRYFGIETNDFHRFKNNGKIKCYVSEQKSKDRCKYIDNYDLTEEKKFWKVITARANGKKPCFGFKMIGKPDEIHTGSYISFRVNNEAEAKSLISYLNTKFANHMLSIRKISQDISDNTCKYIPLVPLDRVWTDDKVCEYLKIEQTLYIN